jgi:hypothetical protein
MSSHMKQSISIDKARNVNSPTEAFMLQPHDQVPHFAVTDVCGGVVRYSAIWQRMNLVLVTVSGAEPSGALNEYAIELRDLVAARPDLETACVITRDAVPGTPCPGILVADRWGEIVFIASGAQPAGLPSADALVDWLEYVQRQCPECQGETR